MKSAFRNQKLVIYSFFQQPASDSGGIITSRSLPVWSERLGLVGKADNVELHPDGTIYPVEYKHGKRNRWQRDEIQLCAQALCLEEMFVKAVKCGAIFYKGSHRRREVVFDEELLKQTQQIIEAVHFLLNSDCVPEPVNDARCPKCSLNEACLPGIIKHPERDSLYIQRLFQEEAP